jgi:signal peptide peptidase SppA
MTEHLNMAGRPWAMYEPAFRQMIEADELRAAILIESDAPEPEPFTYHNAAGVAIIEIVGHIVPDAEYYRTSWGIDATAPIEVQVALAEALADASVDSILLYVDSPGGSTSDLQQCADAIYAARGQKPIMAACANMACSAAYWMASQAGRVAANATAIMGSIGTYCVLPDTSRMYDNFGIKLHLITTGPEKGAGAEGTQVTAAHIAGYQTMVNDLNAVFIAAVARGRDVSIERATELATGAVWIGARALDEGLIDVVEDDITTWAGLIGRNLSDGDPAMAGLISKVFGLGKADDETPDIEAMEDVDELVGDFDADGTDDADVDDVDDVDADDEDSADDVDDTDDDEDPNEGDVEGASAVYARYVAEFGTEFGGKALESGMPLVDARAAYGKHVSAKAEALEAENAALKAQLAALNPDGEVTPASVGDALTVEQSVAIQKQAQSVGDAVAGAAAAIKLP